MKSLFRQLIKTYSKLYLEVSNLPRKYHGETNLLYTHDFSGNRLQQIIVINQWKSHFSVNQTPLKFQDVSFSVFSGGGQDGILLYLLTILGIKHHTIIDIGCENGIGGNSANLIINHGFHGLLIDANQKSIDRGSEFYQSFGLIYGVRPNFVNAFLTKDNINKIISDYIKNDEVDVLSIDIDSIDLYILDSISCVLPRIIVLEFNNAWSPVDSKSVPYNDMFICEWVDGLLYGSASLAAFNKILKAKGYRLVGCDPSGFDAYFIREGKDIFPEVSVQSCYKNSKSWQETHSKLSTSRLKQKEWVEI